MAEVEGISSKRGSRRRAPRPGKLHHIHAAPAASRVEVDGVAWRGEGGSLPRKREVARRLSVCWNVCEGISTADLERGLLRDVLEAIRAGDLGRAQEIARAVDLVVELVDGRPHDCAACRVRGA